MLVSGSEVHSKSTKLELEFWEDIRDRDLYLLRPSLRLLYRKLFHSFPTTKFSFVDSIVLFSFNFEINLEL